MMLVENAVLTLFRMGFFGAAHGCGGGRGWAKSAPFPKICRTYPTMMKLGTVMPCLKKNYTNHVTHPLCSAEISIFYRKSANFAMSRNTDKI